MASDGALRAIRVFVSSTFQDMQAEREELIKRIFPQLRALCEERAVTWGEIDLRWGITDEERDEGRVLPICLAEIDHCRPWFIGILGERYGSVPRVVSDALLAEMPWLAAEEGKSVTELEILHGVLNSAAMKAQAFFYFRDPAVTHALIEEQRRRYEERDPAGQDKLRALKDRIRTSGCALRENYADARELGEQVLEDFTNVIERLYPRESVSSVDREAAAQESFAASRSRVYICRPAYFDHLNQAAAGAGDPLILTGDPGIGKSALLANWALEYRRAHPDQAVILYFIGAYPAGAHWAAMIRRLTAELSSLFQLQLTLPGDADELPSAFADALHRAAARGRFVLVLDGLNQLEDRDGAPDLVWLPTSIPSNARLFVSTLPGRSLEALRRRGCPEFHVEPLERAERERLIIDYLRQYSKSPSPAQVERIAAAPPAANPLYLRTLLEELRLWGEHQTLDRQISHYLAASGPAELFENILARWERDYERDRPGLVREAFSLLWAGHYGLAEAELLDLLGNGAGPLPAAFWSPLWLAAEQSLISRSGVLGFSHPFLRDAVRDRYLPNESAQRAVHLRLADYFTHRPISSRRVAELPWQLAQAREYERLSMALSDPQFLLEVMGADEIEGRGYWAQIEAATPLRAVELLKDAVENDPSFAHTLAIATLFTKWGEYSEALRLHERVRSLRRTPAEEGLWVDTLGDEAANLARLDRLDEALRLSDDELRIARALDDRKHLARAIHVRAGIVGRAEPELAVDLYRQEEQIWRERGDHARIASSLQKQAAIFLNRNRLDEAAALYAEAERLLTSVHAPEELAHLRANQANLALHRGDPATAMAKYRESAQLYASIGARNLLVRAIAGEAQSLLALGDLDAADRQAEIAERQARELRFSIDLAGVILPVRAAIRRERGQLREALHCLLEAEAIARHGGNRLILAQTLDAQGLVLMALRDLDRALACFRESEALSAGGNDGARLQAALQNQASIYLQQGWPREALKKLEERARLGSSDDRADALLKVAEVLRDLKELENAMGAVREARAAAAVSGNLVLNRRALNLQGILLKDTGHPAEAMQAFKDLEIEGRQAEDAIGLQSALGNQSTLLRAGGDVQGALALSREQVRISRDANYGEGICAGLVNQATMLARELGRPGDALLLAEEALAYARSHNLSDLASRIGSIVDAIRARIAGGT